MRKTTTLIFIFLLLVDVAMSQNYFQKLIEFQDTLNFHPSYGGTLKLIETNDNHLLIVSNNYKGTGMNTIVMLTKIELDGTVIWTSRINTGNTYTHTYGIVQLPDSGYVLSGSTRVSSTSYTFFMRIDKSGNLLLSKKIGIPGGAVFSSSLALFNDSTLIIQSEIDEGTGNGPFTGYLIIDLNGNVIDNQGIRINNNFAPNCGNQIQTSDEGHVLCIPLYMNIPSGSLRMPGVVKLDSTGNILWVHQFNMDSCSFYSNYFAMSEMPDGGIIIAGDLFIPQSPQCSFVIKLSASGQLLWSKKIIPHFNITAVTANNNLDIILSGYQNLSSVYKPVFVKMDLNGSILNSYFLSLPINSMSYLNDAVQISDTSFYYVSSITTANKGYLFMKFDFDSLFNCNRNNFNCVDSNITLTDSTGWTGNSSNITTSIYFASQIFDTLIVTDFCNPLTIEEALVAGNDIYIFPNPAKEYIEIHHTPDGNKQQLILIYNSIGDLILERKLAANSLTDKIETAELTNGIYFWKVISEDQIEAKGKIVIIK